MSDSSFQHYGKTRENVQNASEEAELLVRKLRHVAETLKDWRNAPIVIPPYSPLPEVYQKPGMRIEDKDWPTREQVLAALATWKTARDAQDKAWKAIPESDQKVLQRPLL